MAALYAGLRANHEVGVIQLNHALGVDGERDDGLFLSHLGSAGEAFAPERPIDAAPNRLLLCAVVALASCVTFNVNDPVTGVPVPKAVVATVSSLDVVANWSKTSPNWKSWARARSVCRVERKSPTASRCSSRESIRSWIRRMGCRSN